MRQAERDAPGEGADAIIWDEVIASTGEYSTLNWTFMGFMILAASSRRLASRRTPRSPLSVRWSPVRSSARSPG
jgi:hypothetical protein